METPKFAQFLGISLPSATSSLIFSFLTRIEAVLCLESSGVLVTAVNTSNPLRKPRYSCRGLTRGIKVGNPFMEGRKILDKRAHCAVRGAKNCSLRIYKKIF
ncbi:hypothetical protein BY996DRAFT_8027457 [Phakopsora pachyrhizi]|nr:hypothetical protein BY996DRAFT_8027457 [Phakopsora pachyrhizi]